MGLLNVSPEKPLWDFPLPPALPDNYQPHVTEQRKHPRFKCNNSVELHTQDGASFYATLADLSLGGCYVETWSRIALHSCLHTSSSPSWLKSTPLTFKRLKDSGCNRRLVPAQLLLAPTSKSLWTYDPSHGFGHIDGVFVLLEHTATTGNGSNNHLNQIRTPPARRGLGLPRTPAMAPGIADRPWGIVELLGMVIFYRSTHTSQSARCVGHPLLT